MCLHLAGYAHHTFVAHELTVLIVPLQHELEFRQMERLLDVKGRRSQNWERTSQDRLGKAGLEEFKALQADCDDTELAIRFQAHNQVVKVSRSELMHQSVHVSECHTSASEFDMMHALSHTF